MPRPSKKRRNGSLRPPSSRWFVPVIITIWGDACQVASYGRPAVPISLPPDRTKFCQREIMGDCAGHWAGLIKALKKDRSRYLSRGVPVCRFPRSEEHTSELQSLMRISYAVFCLKKKRNI